MFFLNCKHILRVHVFELLTKHLKSFFFFFFTDHSLPPGGALNLLLDELFGVELCL